MNYHMFRPANSWHRRIPDFLDRAALGPWQHGADAHSNIHRDNNEDHDGPEPITRQPHEGQGETCLGPDGGHHAERACDVDSNYESREILRREVPCVSTISEGSEVRNQGGFDQDYNLKLLGQNAFQ